jgi:hypothetical protein
LLRIDTIIWQTADPNYPRNQTNSGEKLSVLFYIRLRNTLSDMWGANTVWSIMVDEQREVNWDDVKDYLAYASAKAPAASLFGYKYGIDRLGIDPCKFSIKELTSIESHTEPFIQIADIFAGAAAYSHNESKKLIHWLDYYDPQHFKGGTWQPPLDFMGEDPVQFSRRERVRFNFIKYIQDCCKANKYQVSIHSKKGLHTFSRSSNINFFYSGCDKN